MWGMKTQIVPVAIGVLVKKGIEKQIDKIPGNINITELQKIALLSLAHTARFLSVSTKTLSSVVSDEKTFLACLILKIVVSDKNR